jgi:hypothetical protein
MSAPSRRLTVTIDELVLHGFDRRDADRIVDAIRTELSAAVAAWAPAAGAGVAHLDAGSVTVPPGSAPGLVGVAVARRIGRALPEHGGSGPADTKHQAAGEGKP